MKLELFVNGQPHALETAPLRRLLDILREDLGLTGTKEGCGEGECGACAVLLDGALVNACLVPAFQLAGRSVTTIEGLGSENDPDPVQQAFLEGGAVQCGFCTPGMVLAARALLDRHPQPNRETIAAGMAGNLCRCTGYEQIVAAIERAAARPTVSGGACPAPRPTVSGGACPALQPTDLATALDRLRESGDALTIVAGGTDLLTSIKLGQERPTEVMDITRIPELRGIERIDGSLEIGAAATFTEILAEPLVAEHFPALGQMAAELGTPPIRNRATLGGNLISASPAADAPPVLLALDARVSLASRDATREIDLVAFFAGYRRTERRADELLTSVRLPLPGRAVRQAFHKVGPRRAQAISKVCLAAKAEMTDAGRLSAVRLAAGSVAPTAVRLVQTAEFLEGRHAGDADLAPRAAQLAAAEVQPIDDVRSTADYRRWVTGNLVARFLRSLQ